MLRRISALLALVALLGSPAAGFDTFWHATASQRVGTEFGFSDDATNIMQLGNFSPDFFGPVAEYAAEHLDNKELAEFNKEGINKTDVKQYAIFLHFDNLNGDLNRNSKFDRIFTQLLKATQSALADYHKKHDLDERTRKILTLMTLGASLHAVQDFYSHSDWIHQNFTSTKMTMVQLPSGELRAPTWFEVRDKLGNPDKWPFQVRTGLFPPVPDNPYTHTHMNHDNSRLIYKEYETPGAPVVPQAPYHQAGPVPTRDQDSASAFAHQQLAVNTAIAASIEWVNKIEENGDAKAAIESAKTWDLRSDNPKLEEELKAGLAAQMALSCAAGKWDGDDPPQDKAELCRAVLENKMNPIGGKSSTFKDKIMGIAATLGLPWALRFSGAFWSVHSKYNILEKLAAGIGGKSGRYKF